MTQVTGTYGCRHRWYTDIYITLVPASEDQNSSLLIQEVPADHYVGAPRKPAESSSQSLIMCACMCLFVCVYYNYVPVHDIMCTCMLNICVVHMCCTCACA